MKLDDFINKNSDGIKNLNTDISAAISKWFFNSINNERYGIENFSSSLAEAESFRFSVAMAEITKQAVALTKAYEQDPRNTMLALEKAFETFF